MLGLFRRLPPTRAGAVLPHQEKRTGCDEPRKELFAEIDAANVDLKAFTDRFYRKICGAELQPVLDTLAWLKRETDVWFEITNLVIPTSTISG